MDGEMFPHKLQTGAVRAIALLSPGPRPYILA